MVSHVYRLKLLQQSLLLLYIFPLFTNRVIQTPILTIVVTAPFSLLSKYSSICMKRLLSISMIHTIDFLQPLYMLRSMSKSRTSCSMDASYVGHMLLQSLWRVIFVSFSSPTWFNESIDIIFIISSSLISLINYVTRFVP